MERTAKAHMAWRIRSLSPGRIEIGGAQPSRAPPKDTPVRCKTDTRGAGAPPNGKSDDDPRTLCLRKRPIDVFDDIVDVLDPHRKPHQIASHASPL